MDQHIESDSGRDHHQAALLQIAKLEMVNLEATLESLTELGSKALGVERVGVWMYSEERSFLVCSSLFVRTGALHERGATLYARDYPTYFDAMSRQRMIAARDARRDLRTSELRVYLAEHAIASVMTVPLWLEGRVMGILSFEHIGPSRMWLPEEQDLATHLGDAVSLALQTEHHRQSEEERRHLGSEKRLLTAESRRRTVAWRAVVSAIADAVLIFDANSEVLFANEAAQHMFGVARADSPQSLIAFVEQYDLFDALNAPLPPDRWPAARALSGETVRGTLVQMVSRSTGSVKFLRISAAPVDDLRRGDRRAVFIASDVTEEAKLDRLRRAFFAAAAHELKTPIAIVMAYAQLLGRDGDSKIDVPKAVRSIERGAVRLDRIVRDLFEATTIDHLDLTLEPVDLAELAQEIADDMGMTASRHHITVRAPRPAVVEGDRQRLTQVLSNVLDNAIKFSPNGGDIDVDVGAVADRVTLEVRDKGIGIPVSEQPRLFQVGYQAVTTSEYQVRGLGIGLYLTRKLVSRHGGTISLESAEGQGTTVRIALPLMEST